MRSGRKPSLRPEVVARIRREHVQGASLGEIARRLNRDDIPTGQGGRQWWPSTVRAVLLRLSHSGLVKRQASSDKHCVVDAIPNAQSFPDLGEG
jgi:hypothetical protein